MSLPKSIKSFNLSKETSYANSVLQAFLHLECVQKWIEKLRNSSFITNSFSESSITKSIYLLYDNISKGNDLDSSQLIKDFDFKSQTLIFKNNAQDPFHFLHNLLKFLHTENNTPINPNFNFELYRQNLINNICNDEKIFAYFNNYLEQTQNSFISNYFNNIKKYNVSCPKCQLLFNYDARKIIRFNLNEIALIRNQIDPSNNNKISLNDCFKCSKKLKNNICPICQNKTAYELQQIYNSASVLIIEINRNNTNSEFKNDLKFYLDLDVSEIIINKKCENKNYKLKAVIGRYGINKYFADVLIKSNYYRFLDCKMGMDVKILKNYVNDLMQFEPQILIYEVNYPNQILEETKKKEDIPNFNQISDLSNTMMINFNLINNSPQLFQINNYVNYFTLKFIIRPQIWDGKEENAIIIYIQASNNLTIKEVINRFFTKLGKPKEAIINFTFNDSQLDINSEEILSNLNIDEYSIIYALKSANYDELVLAIT